MSNIELTPVPPRTHCDICGSALDFENHAIVMVTLNYTDAQYARMTVIGTHVDCLKPKLDMSGMSWLYTGSSTEGLPPYGSQPYPGPA